MFLTIIKVAHLEHCTCYTVPLQKRVLSAVRYWGRLLPVERSDNMQRFLHDMCEEAPNYWEEFAPLYGAMQDWVAKNYPGRTAPTRNKFGRALSRAGFGRHVFRLHRESRTIRVRTGLRIKGSTNELPPDSSLLDGKQYVQF